MIYCGWCEKKPEGAPVSTGICPRCAAKLLAELEPTPEPVPFEPRPGTRYGHYGI